MPPTLLHLKLDRAPPATSTSAAAPWILPSRLCPPDDPPLPDNGAINVFCQILREVSISSATEAELTALFHNGKEACPIRTCLEELGYPQPSTPFITDNSTTFGIANDTVKQKRSKAINMRFYWICDRVRQGQFHIYWKWGILNRADYFTKHHPAKHHQQIRSSYLHSKDDRSTNYFDCLCEDLTYADPSDSGEGVLKSQSPVSPSTPDLLNHNPNGDKRLQVNLLNAEPTNYSLTHKFM